MKIDVTIGYEKDVANLAPSFHIVLAGGNARGVHVGTVMYR
jgi:hypothetical protein